MVSVRPFYLHDECMIAPRQPSWSTEREGQVVATSRHLVVRGLCRIITVYVTSFCSWMNAACPEEQGQAGSYNGAQFVTWTFITVYLKLSIFLILEFVDFLSTECGHNFQ